MKFLGYLFYSFLLIGTSNSTFAKTFFKNTRFLRAVKAGDLNEAQRLVTKGANINTRSKKEKHFHRTALIFCAIRNTPQHERIISYLLSKKANINLQALGPINFSALVLIEAPPL